MIKVENIEVFNFKGALRGMRMPFMSHSKSDSCECDELQCLKCVYGQDEEDDCIAPDGFDYVYSIGIADMELCKKLIKGGSPHRKFLRQIFISMDITAPIYWFKEFDTYKVGTTANSTSTMHTLMKRDLTPKDFSTDHLIAQAKIDFMNIIEALNGLREVYENYETYKDAAVNHGFDMPDKKDIWYSIIQMLPSSFNQTRTVTMNYENALNIIHWRSAHKLEEWRTFCDILINELPYMKEFIGTDGNNENPWEEISLEEYEERR